MFKKNDVTTITITDMTNDGEGVGKAEGYTIFVKDTVIGDVAKVKIVKAKKTYGYGRLIEPVSASKDRVKPVCNVSRQCGGCQIQEMSYDAQLRFKDNKVKNNLIRIGGFSKELIEEISDKILGADDIFNYRNKAQFPVGNDKDGNIITGFYAGRTHSIIPNTDCAIGVKENKLILDKIINTMKQLGITAYDEQTGLGVVRHVLLRKGFHTGELMVCFVINTGKFPREKEMVSHLLNLNDKLTERFGSRIESIAYSVNTEKTNIIMGDNYSVMWGKDTIADTLLGQRFLISPLSFYQVNPIQVEKLYSLAIEYADIKKDDEVWDICCGIGTITLAMAGKASKVHGIEIVPEAIEDANKNSANNGIVNAEFICAAAEQYLPENAGSIHADIVVMDPPRKGMDEKALDAILSVSPEKIVYISCDSATLARDLKYLCHHGYELKRLRVVDMFPQTVHVETVVLLSQQNPDDRIRVKVDLDALDETSAEAKATYKIITDWVQEHYGFHVTNLNIAQVKRKNGIIERDNYNKPKSDDSRQPETTPEKERAITEALKHFKMI